MIFIIIVINIITISSEEVLRTNILFQADSDEILKKSSSDINEIYNLLKKNEEYLITLKGFTNSTGNPENELELSIRRSNAIALLLNNKGISLSRIKTAGFGSLNLKVNKITEENRRVEVAIYKNEEEIKNINEIKQDTRKFKITITDIQGNYLFAEIDFSDTDNTKIISISGPRVIDIPLKNNLKLKISSYGYISQEIFVKENEEKKNIKLKQVKNNTFIYIKGGKFMMGDTFGNGSKNENPPHEVEVKDFYIGKYEVTQQEWNNAMPSNPSIFIGNDLPVHNVTWYEAVQYCNIRSMKEGLAPYYKITKGIKDPNNKNKQIDKYDWMVERNENANGYRLPTEAEWEYAARGGEYSKNYMFSGSYLINDITKYMKTKKIAQNRILDNRELIIYVLIFPIGELKPNELNIYDVNNNVLEWCWDWYDSNYYKKREKNNPIGNISGAERVVRGGFLRNYKVDCRVSARFSQRPYISNIIKNKIGETFTANINSILKLYYFIGFRLVKNNE